MGKLRRRKNVTRTAESNLDLTGSLINLKSWVENKIDEYGEEAYISTDYDWDDHEILKICYESNETDKELASRQRLHDKLIKVQKKVKETKEQKERNLLKSLKEKYE